MAMFDNYKEEEITPTMRKYFGVAAAQDKGTSEGAKKGWEHRQSGGVGAVGSGSEWDNYVDVKQLRSDLGDLSKYLSDSEIGHFVDHWRGDDTPKAAREAVYQAANETALGRYKEHQSRQNGGTRYDRYGAPNW